GHIEALPPCRLLVAAGRHPRSHDRGHIEASVLARRATIGRGVIHGHTTVATLKPPVRGGYCQLASRHPRSHDRRHIEAVAPARAQQSSHVIHGHTTVATLKQLAGRTNLNPSLWSSTVTRPWPH